MIDYNVISTGSRGNAVIINSNILLDCGVSFKALEPHYKGLGLVLLTHIHSDHFNKSCIKRLAAERPMLRFGCMHWLVGELVNIDVKNIDVYNFGETVDYGSFAVIPIPLTHDVPQCGYKIHFSDGKKLIYATDTNNMNGINAPNYDLYMIEANYVTAEIEEKIRQKRSNGEYAYEMQVIKNHLSKEKADDFIYRNIGTTGQYVYLHCHEDSE